MAIPPNNNVAFFVAVFSVLVSVVLLILIDLANELRGAIGGWSSKKEGISLLLDALVKALMYIIRYTNRKGI